jgi:hypothetical protein
MYLLNIIKTDDSLANSIKAIDIIQNTEDYKTGQIWGGMVPVLFVSVYPSVPAHSYLMHPLIQITLLYILKTTFVV